MDYTSELPSLLTTAEVAARLRLHKRTVRRLADAGLLPGVKVGHAYRFNEKRIAELLKA